MSEPESPNVPIPDPARVAAYAELIGRLYLTTSNGGVYSIEDIARGVVSVADSELAARDAEIERLRDEVKRWQGLDREALTLAGNLRVTAEATSSRVMALLDGPEARWMGEPDGWMVSTKKVRAALADAPAEQRGIVTPNCPMSDPDEALIEAIAEAQWNSAIANDADSDAPPWADAQPWDRDWALVQARAAYAAMTEHLGLVERSMTDYQIGYFTEDDGVALQYSGTRNQCEHMLRFHADWFRPESRVLVKTSTWVQSTPRGEWVEVDHGSE